MNNTERPPCFEPLQWKMWIASARHIGGVTRGGYCTDCTPEYQYKMRTQARCNNPEVIFETDEHGFIEGVLPCNQQPSQPSDSRTLDLFTGQPHTPTLR